MPIQKVGKRFRRDLTIRELRQLLKDPNFQHPSSQKRLKDEIEKAKKKKKYDQEEMKRIRRYLKKRPSMRGMEDFVEKGA